MRDAYSQMDIFGDAVNLWLWNMIHWNVWFPRAFEVKHGKPVEETEKSWNYVKCADSYVFLMCSFVKLIEHDQYRYEGVTESFYTQNEMEFKIEYH